MDSWSRRFVVLIALAAAGCGNEYDLIPLHGQASEGDPDGGHDTPAPDFPSNGVSPDGDDDDDGSGGDGDGDDGDGGAIPGGGADCTLTQGYWKNHPEEWPVESLMVGNVEYSKSELLAIFDTAPSGDASYILAHQQIAALLNVANGAGAPAEIAQALDDADAWMIANADADGRLGYGVTSGAAHGQATQIATALDEYNNGNVGPGHCDCP